MRFSGIRSGNGKPNQTAPEVFFGFGENAAFANNTNDAIFNKTMSKTETKTAKVLEIRHKSAAHPPPIRYVFAPMLQEFRRHTRKNEARLWIPIETSLIFRYEFAALSPQTRYAFVAIMLYCGANGIDEIPLDAKFMSSALIIDERTLRKSFDELLSKNLLQERTEREREKKEKTQPDRPPPRTADGVAGVVGVVGSCDSENLFSETKDENPDAKGLLKTSFGKPSAVPDKIENGSGNLSQFSIEDCLRYAKQSENVRNPNALANSLYKTGNADAFILEMLYPAKAVAAEQAKFGAPRAFTGEPCTVCFGAKMADTDGNGFRKCVHCKDERGRSTGFEPHGEKE